MNSAKAMNKNIFKYEFKSRLKSLAVWSLSITALIVVFFSFYPVFADQAAIMNQLMANFPEELRVAFGMGSVPLETVLGFYSFIFLFVQLCLAIQAGNAGFGLVSIEESELTADFLLTKPVSRIKILFGKLLAVGAIFILTNLVVWVISFGAIGLFRAGKDFDPGTLAVLLSSILLFQFFFLSIGLLISLIVKRVRSVTPYSLGLGFGMYVLNAFGGVLGDVKLELITPFKHFDASYIIQNNAMDWALVMINFSVALFALILSTFLYLRRDIQAVS